MSDVVVTLPKAFQWEGLAGLEAWCAEGDAAGEPLSGAEYAFSISGKPRIDPGERVYVVHCGYLIGFAPLVRLERWKGRGRNVLYNLIRAGGAEAVTIREHIKGFRGFRYRWWDRAIEIPFPDWREVCDG